MVHEFLSVSLSGELMPYISEIISVKIHMYKAYLNTGHDHILFLTFT